MRYPILIALAMILISNKLHSTTLAESLTSALQSNSSIKVSKIDYQIHRYNKGDAIFNLFPQLDINSRYLLNTIYDAHSIYDAHYTSYSILLPIFVPNNIMHIVSQKYITDNAKLQHKKNIIEIFDRITALHIDLITLEQLSKTITEQLILLAAHKEMINIKLALGEATDLDGKRIDYESKHLLNEHVKVKNEIRSKKDIYKNITYLEAENLTMPDITIEIPEINEQNIAHIMSKDIDLAMIKNDIKNKAAKSIKSKLFLLPNINLNYLIVDTRQGSTSLYLDISFPGIRNLWSLNNNVKKAKLDKYKSILLYLDKIQKKEIEIKAILNNLILMSSELSALESFVIMQDDIYRMTEMQFNTGKKNIMDLLDKQVALFKSEYELVKLQNNLKAQYLSFLLKNHEDQYRNIFLDDKYSI